MNKHGEVALLSKEELKLQKKGIENMSLEELHAWVKICIRNEQAVEYNKARRGWKESRAKAESYIEKIST